MEESEFLSIKREKLIKNIEDSLFFKFDDSIKKELIEFIKVSDEKSLDTFSSIYNKYLENYEDLDKEKIGNIHSTYDNIDGIFKNAFNDLGSIESEILENKLNNL